MVKTIKIGSRTIGLGLPVFVIAEIGVNHEGDIKTCAQLTKSAIAAGADAIKLQTSNPDENYAPGTKSHEIYSTCQLSQHETEDMFSLAQSLGAEAFTTTDKSGLSWLETLSPSPAAYKVSSGLMDHIPMIQRLAATGKPLIMSTGISTIPSIQESVNTARMSGDGGVSLLQCTSLYPTPRNLLNLASIKRLSELFECPVGLSDHSIGITAAPLAVAAGATIIEKHFTFDRHRPGFDHRISLEASEFEQMVKAIRDAELVMGNDQKELLPEQVDTAVSMRRCVIATKNIPAGHKITEENVGVMRLGDNQEGLHPRHFHEILGTFTQLSLRAYEAIPKDFIDR